MRNGIATKIFSSHGLIAGVSLVFLSFCLGGLFWLRRYVDLVTRDILDISILSLIVALGIIIALTVWISVRQKRQILKPIKQLLTATQNSLRNDSAEYVDVASDDELGLLADAYNQMLYARKVVEERLFKVVETAVDAIITIDGTGIVKSMNSATTALLGYTEDDLIGSNIASIMPEPHRSKHDNYLKSYLTTRNKKIIGKSRELEAQTKSGKLIPILLSVSEIIVEEDHLFVGFIHDIRADKKRAEELNTLNQQLAKENSEKSLLNELSNILRDIDVIDEFAEKVIDFFVTHQSVLLAFFYYFNHKASLLATYGLSEEEVMKKKKSLSSGLLNECVNRQKLIIIDTPPKGYFKVSSGVGESEPEQILLLPLVFNNKVIAVIELGLLKPISETAFLDNLAREMAIQLNITIAKLQLEELLEKTEQQREYLQSQEQELRSSNEELRSKTEILKQSEEELSATNEELYTQIRLIEDQKKSIEHQKQEIEKSSQYKSEFLANMSHELRTPLNSLLILAQSFKENEPGNLNQEQVAEANIIYESGQDLLGLINDVLDISKIESGSFELELQALDFRDFIIALNNQFMPLARQKGLNFAIISDETIPNTIKVDPVRLSQVLKNLLANAIKFTEKGDVQLKIFLAGESLFFEVKDTGIGIAKEMQELIFEEFKQADGSTSRKYGGTGLGLSISKKLSELMHGNLVLQSSLGEGATFTLEVPLIKVEQNEHSTPQPPKVQVSTKETSDDRFNSRILIVDSDEDIQDNLFEAIKRQYPDVDIYLGSTAEEARAMLNNNSFDFIITGLNLQAAPGVDFIQEIVEKLHIVVPFIIYTSVVLTEEEYRKLKQYSGKVVIQNAHAIERLLDEVGLFIHAESQGNEYQSMSLLASDDNENEILGIKVLLVDDDLRNTFALSKVLEGKGLEVQIADNGALALDKLATSDVDIILMDMMMPVMDGYEAIKKIRSMQAYQNLPIIALTAKASQIDKEKCLDVGANDYMSKPINVDELIDIINIWFHKPRDQA